MGPWWLFALAWAGAPEDAVVAAFTPRHAEATCASIAPDVPAEERLAAFVAVAEGVEMPPWVPLAAAGCVAESAREPIARVAVDRWIAEPATAGLALAALGRLDALPAEVALPIATLAVTRGRDDARFASLALPALEASRHDAVREAVRP